MSYELLFQRMLRWHGGSWTAACSRKSSRNWPRVWETGYSSCPRQKSRSLHIHVAASIFCWLLSMAAIAQGSEPVAHCAIPNGQALNSVGNESEMELADCLIDSGKYGLAILLLQRVVARQPNDDKAVDRLRRVEQLLGLPQNTQGERSPSPGWLDDIRHSGWLAITAGHDDNINSATANETISIPLLNYRRLDLSAPLVRHESYFIGMHGGIKSAYAIAPTWDVTLLGAASLRLNAEEIAYAPHNYLASASLTKHLGAIALNVEVKGEWHWLAAYSILENKAVTGSVEIALSDSLTVKLAPESGRLHYPMFKGLTTRDDGWSIGIRDRWTGLSFQTERGSERSTGLIHDLDRQYTRSTLSWERRFDKIGQMTIGMSSGRSDYTEFSRLFNTYRRDQTRHWFVALDYPLTKTWHVVPQFVETRNDSNLDLVSFVRTQWLAEFRRIF